MSNVRPQFFAAEYAGTATRFEYGYNPNTEMYCGVAKNEHGKTLLQTPWVYTDKLAAAEGARREWASERA